MSEKQQFLNSSSSPYNSYAKHVENEVRDFIVKNYEPSINYLKSKVYGEYNYIFHHTYGDRNRHLFFEVNSLIVYKEDGTPVPGGISNIRLIYSSDEDDVITNKLSEIFKTN